MQRRVFGGVVLSAAVLVVGCSAGGSGTPADSPVTVETSQLFVTVQNIAGLPLTDVTIAVVPAGVQPEYTKYYSRMESSEKRDISLSEFNGRDGTPLNLQVVRPRSVHVTATDLNGKAYDVELPWD
jgi:hypothetical protein